MVVRWCGTGWLEEMYGRVDFEDCDNVVSDVLRKDTQDQSSFSVVNQMQTRRGVVSKAAEQLQLQLHHATGACPRAPGMWSLIMSRFL